MTVPRVLTHPRDLTATKCLTTRRQLMLASNDRSARLQPRDYDHLIRLAERKIGPGFPERAQQYRNMKRRAFW